VGTKSFEGVRFAVYSHDHEPPHVHATTPDVIMIFDLLGNGKIRLSRREDAITPGNAKRNVKAKIRRVAKENADELMALWEKTHGTR
jgi:hypothetical protein